MKRSVVLVEDDANIRELTEEALGLFGYRVASFDTADKAWTFLLGQHAERTDLLFTDVMMPGTMDGLQLAALAKSELGIPSVVCSGYCDSSAEMVDVFLAKPWNVEKLRYACEAALEPKPKRPFSFTTS